MTIKELNELIDLIKLQKSESNTLEIKAAKIDCPKKLYDTLSSFSNQDEGGVIVFGIDEKNDFEECGVYDANDLQKQLNNQCLQMSPEVRPVLTVLNKDGKVFVAAEIPSLDITERPCFYKGVGRIKGSYVRVGDSDEHMTEYEIYSFEAYRKKYQDDIREIPRITAEFIRSNLVDEYINRIKNGKPNLAVLKESVIENLMSIKKNDNYTISAVLTFGVYPQALFPQLRINAIVVPGTEIGDINVEGQRFIDNQKIEGNISEMLEGAIAFVRRNMKTATYIDDKTGERRDKLEYPIIAVREAVLNALVHRDYSINTEGMPIQLIMYTDRLEIINPGGLYGRLTVDQLGKVQPDTRNPVLVNLLETMGVTENRYSGIPTIKKAMEEEGLLAPIFEENRGTFIVRLYNSTHFKNIEDDDMAVSSDSRNINIVKNKVDERILLEFLTVARSRQEIADFLGRESISYVMHKFIEPLVAAGKVAMTMPDKPKSKNQKFIYTENL